MPLKLFDINRKVNDYNYSIKRKFDSTIDYDSGILLLKIYVEERAQSPYHWFLKDNKKPPFDIAIDSTNGTINYIKLFFQDERIAFKNKGFSCNTIITGIPIFDINTYDKEKYYIFEDGHMDSFIFDNDLYLSIRDMKPELIIDFDTTISFLFTSDKYFSGIIIRSLLDSEKEELKKAKILNKKY